MLLVFIFAVWVAYPTVLFNLFFILSWLGLSLAEGILFAEMKNSTCDTTNAVLRLSVKSWLMWDLVIRWCFFIAFIGLLAVLSYSRWRKKESTFYWDMPHEEKMPYQDIKITIEGHRTELTAFVWCYVICSLAWGSLGAVIASKASIYCQNESKFDWQVELAFSVIR